MTISINARLLMLSATIGTGSLLIGLAPSGAAAADIRARLSPDLIAQHCLANGVGSNVEGVFMLAGGARLTGSIACTDADMVAPPAQRSHDDDGAEGYEEEEDGDDD